MVDYVVIPAHNEEKNISNVIKEVKKFNSNIVVIDDGSKDKTYEECRTFKQRNLSGLRKITPQMKLELQKMLDRNKRNNTMYEGSTKFAKEL